VDEPPLADPNSQTATEPQEKIKVTLQVPTLTNKEFATIEVQTDKAPTELYYRLDLKDEWTSIIDTGTFQMSDNSNVFIKAVLNENNITEVSQYIECFDRVKPTFSTAVKNFSEITISAKDNLAGVKAIYINDEVITQFDSRNENDLLVTYIYNTGSAENILVQVEDKVGNISDVQKISTKTNYNGDTSSSQDTSSSTASTDDKGKIGNAKLTIIPPEWTNTKSALVKVEISSGNNLNTIMAKIDRNGTWFDITETLDFTISQNCDVYVKAIDTDNRETLVSATILCFDYGAPSIKAQQDKDEINIVAMDDLSGVAYVYVNGKPFKVDDAGGITVSVDNKITFYIQAKDNAQNLSKTITVKPTGVSSTTGEQEVEYNEKETGKTFFINIGGSEYTVEELQKLGIPIYIFPEADEDTLRAILNARGDEIFTTNTGMAINPLDKYREVYDRNGNLFYQEENGTLDYILFNSDGEAVYWDGNYKNKDWYFKDGTPIYWDDNGNQIDNPDDNQPVGENPEDETTVDEVDGEEEKKKTSSGDLILWVSVSVVGVGAAVIFFIKAKEKQKFSKEDFYERPVDESEDEDDSDLDDDEFNQFKNFDDTDDSIETYEF